MCITVLLALLVANCVGARPTTPTTSQWSFAWDSDPSPSHLGKRGGNGTPSAPLSGAVPSYPGLSSHSNAILGTLPVQPHARYRPTFWSPHPYMRAYDSLPKPDVDKYRGRHDDEILGQDSEHAMSPDRSGEQESPRQAAHEKDADGTRKPVRMLIDSPEYRSCGTCQGSGRRVPPAGTHSRGVTTAGVDDSKVGVHGGRRGVPSSSSHGGGRKLGALGGGSDPDPGSGGGGGGSDPGSGGGGVSPDPGHGGGVVVPAPPRRLRLA